MARPISGKKTKEDENALRQLEAMSKYCFWTHQILARRFCLDNKGNFEEFQIAYETLLFAIYYFKVSDQEISSESRFSKVLNQATPFEDFLNSALNRFSNGDDGGIFDEILVEIMKSLIIEHRIIAMNTEVACDFKKNRNCSTSEHLGQLKFFFNIEICSIMDTVLNLTETNPVNRLAHYTKCDDFYLENIRESLLVLKKICTKYGLYPHKFDLLYAEDIILKSDCKHLQADASAFFLQIPENDPPIIFNYCTEEKCYFENEHPRKCYYYLEFDIENYDFTITMKDIEKTMDSFSRKNGSYTSNRSQKFTTKSVQICIDMSAENYSKKIAITHIESQLVSTMLFFRESLKLKHLAAIKNGHFLENISAPEIDFERLNAQKNLLMYGGYRGRVSNNSLACGMYIWDLEHLYGISHTIIEAFLAEDTAQRDTVKEKLAAVTIAPNKGDPRNSIEAVKEALTRLNCDMSRKSLHRYYDFFRKKVDSCLTHVLWRR